MDNSSKWQNTIRFILGTVKECFYAFCSVVFIYTIILFIGSHIWVDYSEYAVGTAIMKKIINNSYNVDFLFSNNIWSLSLDLHLKMLIVCLITSSVCTFLLVKNYFYDVMGVINRMVLWVIPNTAITAFFFVDSHLFDYKTAFVVAFVPAIFFTHYSMKLMSVILPDLGDIHTFILFIFRKIRRL